MNYAGFLVRYQFRYKKTARYFGKYIRVSKTDKYDIRINDDEFKLFRNTHPEDIPDDYVEYKGLIYLTSRKLILSNCCIFHAVSFYWKEKAWLLTGNSGIGKTTQFMNWNGIFPNEITMISGDMPLLDFTGDYILVHPSPWNGKERIQGSISAKLGGVFVLRQSENNTVMHAEIKNAILSVFSQFAIIPEKEREIRILAEMTEKTIEKVPIWIFANDGSENSTLMLRDYILEYVEKENQTL